MKMVFEPETLKDINGMMVNGIRQAKKNMMQIQHCSGTLTSAWACHCLVVLGKAATCKTMKLN